MDASLRESVRSLRRFPVLYGVTWALFIAVVGTIGVSLWTRASSAGDGFMVVAAYVIHCAAILVGSISAGRAVAERGWYHGGLVGLTYALLMVAIGALVYNTFMFSPGALFRLFILTLIGCFGGIIGVNLRTD